MKRKLKRILRTQSDVLLQIFIVGIALLIVTLVYMPKVAQIVTKISTYNNEKTRMESLKFKLSSLNSMSESDTKSLYSVAESALPSEKDFPSILIAIDNLAQETNFTLDDVSFAPGIVSTESAVKVDEGINQTSVSEQVKETESGALALMVTVKGRGTTAQFDEFVKRIPMVRRLFDIESVKASYFTDVEDLLLTELVLRAYYLPPVAEIGSVESQLPEFTAENQNILNLLETYPDLNFVQAISEGSQDVPLGKTNLFE